MTKHSTYKSVIIYKKYNGFYSAYVNNRFIYADTLQGIRHFISDELKTPIYTADNVPQSDKDKYYQAYRNSVERL